MSNTKDAQENKNTDSSVVIAARSKCTEDEKIVSSIKRNISDIEAYSKSCGDFNLAEKICEEADSKRRKIQSDLVYLQYRKDCVCAAAAVSEDENNLLKNEDLVQALTKFKLVVAYYSQ